MIVSASSIHFRGSENLHTLHIENTAQHPLIFKMKITHTDLFSIAPSKGIITTQKKTLITIKLNRSIDFNAKLLISYAQLTVGGGEDGQSIDLQWKKIEKQDHKNIIIPISRTSPKEPEEKREEKPTYKKTDSPIYEMEIKQEESNGNSSRGPEIALKKSVSLKGSTSLFRSVEDLDKRELAISRGQNQRLEKELEEERAKNKRMTEQLIEKEKKLMYLSNMRQMQVNKSFRKEEDGVELGCANTLLAVFLLIMIGFFLSKCDLPYSFL